jgi:hypothetical protein
MKPLFVHVLIAWKPNSRLSKRRPLSINYLKKRDLANNAEQIQELKSARSDLQFPGFEDLRPRT